MQEPIHQTEKTPRYDQLPTLKMFHNDGAQIRCIVGPVGSGKTTAASVEVCSFLPRHICREFGIKKTRWIIVRNTYVELIDTTQRTVFDWFPSGDYHKQEKIYHLRDAQYGCEIELMFRSCDRPEDVKKFKSLELTGYWIDESIEVAQEIKNMLKNRIGRYPKKCPVRFGIETTNPPDVEHPTYSEFKWMTPIPGPVPESRPLKNHHGFWQPERENEKNLRPGYYDNLITDYRDNPDWIATYVKGHPGIIVKGKLVYRHFRKEYHVSSKPIIPSGNQFIRGWDNSGNCPACIVVQQAPDGCIHVLREFNSDVENIVDFTRRVAKALAMQFPGASYTDYADPAGAAKYSRREGGFTSNEELMRECGVLVISSDQNFSARTGAVETALQRSNGILIDPSCTRLINGFVGGYCYSEVGTTGAYRDTPDKNRFSHIHDALQYVMVKLIKMARSWGDIDMDKVGV
jgi:hypothetical protein